MTAAKQIRYCKTFFCKVRSGWYCCADCRERGDCPDPCLNHPSRCGLENINKRSTTK